MSSSLWMNFLQDKRDCWLSHTPSESLSVILSPFSVWGWNSHVSDVYSVKCSQSGKIFNICSVAFLPPLLGILQYKHNHKYLNNEAHSVSLTQTTSVLVKTFVDIMHPLTLTWSIKCTHKTPVCPSWGNWSKYYKQILNSMKGLPT